MYVFKERTVKFLLSLLMALALFIPEAEARQKCKGLTSGSLACNSLVSPYVPKCNLKGCK